MKYWVLLFCLAFTPQILSAQANLDSLYNTWQDESVEDTVRCKAIDDLIWEGFMYSNADSALVLAQMQYDFTVSQKLLSQQSNALNTLGVCYWSKGEYVTAIRYYEKNLRLSDSIHNVKGIATSLNNIGAIYHNQGYYPKALQYFNRSLKLYEEQRDTHGIAVSIGNIGMIYREQNDLDKALEYAEISLKLYEQLGEAWGQAKELMNVGNIYASKKNYQKGLEYYLKAISIRETINDKRGLINALNMTGTLLAKMNRITEALPYHERAIKMAKAYGERRGYVSSLIEHGLTLNLKGDYQKAIEQCKCAYDSLKEIGLLKEQKKACNCLYGAYKMAGNETQALRYFEEEQVLQDSLQETETAKKLQQMEFEKQLLADSAVHYAEDLERQNKFDQELIKEHSLRNIALVSGFFSLLLAIGLYARSRYIKRTNNRLQKERDRSDELLLNILPFEVAEELKQKGESEARDFDKVTVLFTDFMGFTETAQSMSAKELVNEVNVCFKAFDSIIDKYGIEKIKTIGDAYMAAGGLHVPRTSEPADVVNAALEMQEFMKARKMERSDQGLSAFEMRVGIHTGPVVAGIVGVKKFQYDIWGDTVNTASRMESNGAVGKVNVSNDTYELIKTGANFNFESRGKIEVKGKGEMEMWFVSKAV